MPYIDNFSKLNNENVEFKYTDKTNIFVYGIIIVLS